MEAREVAKNVIEAMEEKKAVDIRVLDIAGISSIGDYFIIAGGNNVNQVHAIVDEIDERLGRKGVQPKHVEGYQNANWVLMDYGDVIVHVFDSENRLYYDLERIWKDGKSMDLAEI
ncbi:MAG: ribosome silencing factor [Lachnospiraceae bacterium]|nr:ribosome silencing factor [Lachnospiraceae bacterium]